MECIELDLSFSLKTYHTLREVCFSIGIALQFNYSRLSSHFMRFIGAMAVQYDLYQHSLPCHRGKHSITVLRKKKKKHGWQKFCGQAAKVTVHHRLHKVKYISPLMNHYPPETLQKHDLAREERTSVFFLSYMSQARGLNFQFVCLFFLQERREWS